MKCPCRGCTDRTITCHGVCARYKEWQKYNEDEKTWLEGHKQIPSERLRKYSAMKIKRIARGWKRCKGGNNDG